MSWHTYYAVYSRSPAPSATHHKTCPPPQCRTIAERRTRQNRHFFSTLLEQSGFKDIRVVPETFVVRAQAPDGSRIVMLLSPDQMTEVVMPNTKQGMQGNSSQPLAASPVFKPATATR